MEKEERARLILEVETALLSQNPHAFEVRDALLPSKIYKYTRCHDKLMENVEMEQLWYANPLEFNDPYDSAMSIDISSEEWGKIRSEVWGNLPPVYGADRGSARLYEHLEYLRATELDKYYKELVEQNRSSLAVTCFSEQNDSILMWSHYADYHKGVCLEFDTATMSRENVASLFPALYKDDLFTQYFTETISNESLSKVACLRKSSRWEYEHEWRSIIPNLKQEKGMLSGGWPVSRILLGTKIAEEHKKILLSLGAKCKIPVHEMKRELTKFRLFANPYEVGADPYANS